MKAEELQSLILRMDKFNDSVRNVLKRKDIPPDIRKEIRDKLVTYALFRRYLRLLKKTL